MLNFHETKMTLLRQADHNAETRAQRITEMADDLFTAKLAALACGTPGGTDYQARPGYNIWSVMDDIDTADRIPVARAIIANDALWVGTLMLKLVLEQLRKDAQQDAEDYDEENFNARKFGAT